MISPARVAAYDALRLVSSGRADLPAAIAAVRETLADDRDRALAAQIVSGVQRWRAALDHLVAAMARRGVDRLDAEVLDILRLGIYQLLHLTRVPASAVVDDAVSLTRRAGKSSASGFANAVLRRISRSRGHLPLPAAPVDPGDAAAALDYLSITLSHPRWLAARWYERLGYEAARRWMLFDNEPAPLTLRANRLRTTRAALAARLAEADVGVAPTRRAPDGLVVERGHPLRSADPAEAWFFVQDEASQLVALVAQSIAGRSVLDTCASPGGKTTAIAAAMNGAGLLVACDVRPRRVELLRQTVSASGARNVRLVQADLMRPLPFTRQFDAVILDAPCSGLGTLRRDPDLRWRRHEADLAVLAAAERVMLANAADAVRPGGRLLYATCSSEPEENEAVVDALLHARPGFAIDHIGRAAPALPADVIDARGFLRTQPHAHGLEAFFAAVLART